MKINKEIFYRNIIILILLSLTIILVINNKKLKNDLKGQQSMKIIEATNTTCDTQTELETPLKEVPEPVKEVLTYRMTYYYENDNTGSKNITASGLKTSDFQINERGWYTYKGKLVVATANKRLLSWDRYKNSTQKMFNLYDTLKLEIQGQEYEAIVLDVCGACMLSPKIDLFVKDKVSGLDTTVKVK